MGLQESLAALEALIERGSTYEARPGVRALARARRLRREDAFRLARVARRAGLQEIAVRLLHRTVRSRKSLRMGATEAEIGEYAAALDGLGHTEEALSLLSGLSREHDPSILLFLGWARRGRFEYAAAAEAFERMRSHRALGALGRQSSRVELAGALVFGPAEARARARELLEEALADPALRRLPRLLGFALVYRLQLAVLERDTRPRARIFREIDAAGFAPGTVLSEKLALWRAAADGDLRTLRAAGLKLGRLGEWEGARLAALLEAERTGDRELRLQLYFRSPFPAFRERVAPLFGPRGAPESYEWTIGEGKGPLAELSALQGALAPRRAPLKQGQALQRALATLLEDFCRPATVGRLHERLFPGTPFHPRRSVDRIHQILRRLRRWLKSSGLPLALLEEDRSYRLVARSRCKIVIHRAGLDSAAARPPVSSRFEPYLANLEKRFGAAVFGTLEAARALGVRPQVARRYLSAGVAGSRLERLGAGPQTRYRFKIIVD
jgi:hypothetical protein